MSVRPTVAGANSGAGRRSPVTAYGAGASGGGGMDKGAASAGAPSPRDRADDAAAALLPPRPSGFRQQLLALLVLALLWMADHVSTPWPEAHGDSKVGLLRWHRAHEGHRHDVQRAALRRLVAATLHALADAEAAVLAFHRDAARGGGGGLMQGLPATGAAGAGAEEVVTGADAASHEALMARLSSPAHPVISEEGVSAGPVGLRDVQAWLRRRAHDTHGAVSAGDAAGSGALLASTTAGGGGGAADGRLRGGGDADDAASDADEDDDHETVVLVDPLDATAEFAASAAAVAAGGGRAAGDGEDPAALSRYVSLQACVVRGGRPVAGVLRFPFTGRTYVATVEPAPEVEDSGGGGGGGDAHGADAGEGGGAKGGVSDGSHDRESDPDDRKVVRVWRVVDGDAELFDDAPPADDGDGSTAATPGTATATADAWAKRLAHAVLSGAGAVVERRIDVGGSSDGAADSDAWWFGYPSRAQAGAICRDDDGGNRPRGAAAPAHATGAFDCAAVDADDAVVAPDASTPPLRLVVTRSHFRTGPTSSVPGTATLAQAVAAVTAGCGGGEGAAAGGAAAVVRAGGAGYKLAAVVDGVLRRRRAAAQGDVVVDAALVEEGAAAASSAADADTLFADAADAYIHEGPVRSWDVCAGALLVAAAGGRVSGWAGERHAFCLPRPWFEAAGAASPRSGSGGKSLFATTGVVAAASPRLHAALLGGAILLPPPPPQQQPAAPAAAGRGAR